MSVALSHQERTALAGLLQDGTFAAAEGELGPCCANIGQLRDMFEMLRAGPSDRVDADNYLRAYRGAAEDHDLGPNLTRIATWAFGLETPDSSFDAARFLRRLGRHIDRGGGSVAAIYDWLDEAPQADIAGERTRTSYVRDRLVALFWVRLGQVADPAELGMADIISFWLDTCDLDTCDDDHEGPAGRTPSRAGEP